MMVMQVIVEWLFFLLCICVIKAGHQAFTEDDLNSKDPMMQFTAWFKEACEATENSKTEANAMTIATATK